MHFARSTVGALIIGCAILLLQACSESGSDPREVSGSGSAGFAGVYTSVEDADVSFEFTSSGTVVAAMGGEKGQPGTYTIDGEKVIVDFNGQQTTFIRDGNCIEDHQNMFGRLCKGGAAGAASNVSTRTPPATTGIWVATNDDGTFTIDFKAGNAFTFAFTPSAASQMGDKPQAMEGTFVIEGDTLHSKLSDSTPMVLKWVNGTYESTAFGLPMKFTKQ